MRPISSVVNQILLGDCLDVLKEIESDSCCAIVCDPPYALGTKEPTGEEIDAYLNGAELDSHGDFMGREWQLPSVAIWKEALRVLKPGGYCASFCGTRTFDLMDAGMRQAGFTDEGVFTEKFGLTYMSWLHSQGMPKSRSIHKDLLKLPSVSQEVKDRYVGYGTALKPSWEPILLFKKPGSPLVNPDLKAPFIYSGKTTKRESSLDGRIDNQHPTRKPLKLLRHLIPLVTPPGGTVLDMFVGSGTTCQAAAELGFNWIGIERDPEFYELSKKRMEIVVADLRPKDEASDFMGLMELLGDG
jgi:site-specific DNA-methyltransferase (adenine-specific)